MNSKYLYIGFAALFGTSLRTGIGLIAAGASFPYSTLVINIVASFALVVLYEVFRKHELLPPMVITAVGTGLIGSFSTMSSVAYDTASFIQTGEYLLAIANYSLNMILCLLGAAAGLLAARLIMRPKKRKGLA